MSKISLRTFILNTQGKKVGVPWDESRHVGQCVSLAQQYISQCLEQPAKARGNAKDWDESYVREGLGNITKNPQYGDLIVFNPPYAGTYGHIAIFIDNNTMYDQNNGSHDNRCAGFAKMMRGGVYIHPNAELKPNCEDPDLQQRPEYTPGTYRTNFNMNLRKGPNGEIVKVKETTQALRSALLYKGLNDPAIIKKGTNLTALEIINHKNSYWLKNYSGYVCIKGTNEFCTKIG